MFLSQNTHQEAILDKVALAIPAFHCYGHKASCQEFRTKYFDL